MITQKRRYSHEATPNPYALAIFPEITRDLCYASGCGKPIALWQSRAGLRWRHVALRR